VNDEQDNRAFQQRSSSGLTEDVDDAQQLLVSQSVGDFIWLSKSCVLENLISSVIQGLVSFNFCAN
jgi:hypothetical protein